jgi:acetolactate synthase-1/2/3 large subunit
VPGESYLDLLDGLYNQRNRIQLVTCRFEAGAVHMAEAQGKLTGGPASPSSPAGPGACHAAIGVHVAQQDSTPLVLLVGQIPVSETDRESFQEVDYRRFFSPIAKWVTQIDEASRIPELMRHAFDVAGQRPARAGRRGAVEEMQKHLAAVPDVGPQPDAAAASGAGRDPAPDGDARPGGAPARDPRRGRVDRGGPGRDPRLPRGQRHPGRRLLPPAGLFDGTSAQYAGDLGVGADAGLVQKAREADLILAIGTRLGEPVSQGYTLFDLAGRQPIVHVHPEQTEIGRVHRAALGIVADVNAFAAAAAAAPRVPARAGAPGGRRCARRGRRRRSRPPTRAR